MCVEQSTQYGVRAGVLAVAGGGGGYPLVRCVAAEEPAA
ncbi:hypothetical protein CSPX01_07192 [Colletotrichum filicis]|nr:hypothetical protein CSPX01_07192 [Colletotrichum filicis]